MKTLVRTAVLGLGLLIGCARSPKAGPVPIRLEGAVVTSSVEWQADLTAFELVSRPGVCDPNVRIRQLELHRVVDGSPLVIPIDLDNVRSGDTSSNVLLLPGDLVRVKLAK